MARIRSVHPDICASQTLAGLPAELERTFVRLWTHCDDEGRCEDRPRLIKAGIYPEHDDMTWERVDADLWELGRIGLIIRYEHAGKGYIAVRSWSEYQHPQKPRESKFPAPPDETGPEPSRTSRVTVRDPSSNGMGLELGVGEGEGEGEGVVTPPSSLTTTLALVPATMSPPATGRANDIQAVFDAWRDATGKHRAKLDAKRRRRITNALASYPLNDIIDAVRGWQHSPHHRGENDRGTVYNSLDLLLRDAERIEQFRDLERNGPTPRPRDASLAAIEAVLIQRGSA